MSDEDIKGLQVPSDADVQSVLSLYASDENPDEYSDAYSQLKNFVDYSLDAYKVNSTKSKNELMSVSIVSNISPFTVRSWTNTLAGFRSHVFGINLQ